MYNNTIAKVVALLHTGNCKQVGKMKKNSKIPIRILKSCAKKLKFNGFKSVI